MAPKVPFGKEMRKEFLFDEDYLNLNHGSFGTYPKAIQKAMRKYQDASEARPDEYIRYEYPKLLDESREAAAQLLNVPVDTVTFVPNATTGINTVLRNIEWAPGDRIIYFATIYGACERTIAYLEETTTVESVRISYTYPVSDSFFVTALTETVHRERAAGHNPRVCLFDTISSMPGCRMPFAALARTCAALGVLSLVDGAHGIGHVALDLRALDPDFLVSNCHKWLLVPRGCAVFYVPARNQHLIRSTLPTSHGFVPRPRPGLTFTNPLPPSTKSPYVANLEFVGTVDTAPYACVKDAIRWREQVCGGEAAIRAYTVALNKAASQRVAEMLGTEYMDNEEESLRECNMSNVRLPLDSEQVKALCKGKQEFDGVALRDWMTFRAMKDHGAFMAFMYYAGHWWVRLSAQIYLDLADFERAAAILKIICDDVKQSKFLESPKANL